MTVNVFSVPVFFVVFRETLETVVIVSVLLAFLKQTLDGPSADRVVYKKLVKQVCCFLLFFSSRDCTTLSLSLCERTENNQSNILVFHQ